ncbi:MAG TPA: DUF1523 family protein [Paracoccaceae bacterium]|nr:DUF1523 family protein [Paracoccaceae bacterium]
MLNKIKWTLYAVLVLGLFAFLHWSLPHYDVARILDTEIKRQAVETENAQGETVTRTEDVRYISTARPDGSVYVYRNQDTGWGWPPYFKFDSANLAAEADNHSSTKENPEWYFIEHYGWRFTLLSMFPNAIEITPAEGPDETIVPWFNIAVYALVLGLLIYVRWRIRRGLSSAADEIADT